MGWITVNFLLNRIGSKSKSKGMKTVAIMDLGGGSTQVVFQIPRATTKNLSKQYISTFSFSGNDYCVFQHSFLGYGLNEARTKLMAGTSSKCIPQQSLDRLQDEKGQKYYKIDVHECLHETKKILNLNKPCGSFPICFYNGVPMPLDFSFENLEIYAFSNFYEVMNPFLTTRDVMDFPLFSYWNSILAHCQDRQSIDIPMHLSLQSAFEKYPNFCMNAVYIYSLLKHGYKIYNPHYRINVVKKINEFETCWALGAALNMLDWFRLESSSGT